MLVTTNFSLTYFLVSGEIENSGVPANLLIVETEGMSVLTGWAAGKFSGEKVAAAVKASGLAEHAASTGVIIPGYVSQISGEIEEGLPGWEVLVGPGEASDLGSVPEGAGRAVTPCPPFASNPPTLWPRCPTARCSTKRRCAQASSTWNCRAAGEGSCGLCKVELEGRDTPVLACQTKVTSDIVVLSTRAPRRASPGAGRQPFPGRSRAAARPRAPYPAVPPAAAHRASGFHRRALQRLDSADARTGPRQWRPCRVSCDLSVLRQSGGQRSAQTDGKLTVALRSRQPGFGCARCKPGTAPARVLGLAVDIGTTTVAAQLVDLDDGSLLATQTSYNLQIRRGADVISRIDYARTGERLEELRSLVLETINTPDRADGARQRG